MTTNERITYSGHFVNQIRNHFYSPNRNGDSAMNCADKFRDQEWMALDGEAGDNTQSDLYEFGKSNKTLLDFIIDVIECMRLNVKNSEG